MTPGTPPVNAVRERSAAVDNGENRRVSLDLVIILLTVQVVISRTVMGLLRANRRRTRAAAVADDEDTILD